MRIRPQLNLKQKPSPKTRLFIDTAGMEQSVIPSRLHLSDEKCFSSKMP